MAVLLLLLAALAVPFCWRQNNALTVSRYEYASPKVGEALEGFTTVIIINLFTGSIIMLSLGIIGYYISKIYDEIKGRPKYIVRSTCGELKNTATAPKDVL